MKVIEVARVNTNAAFDFANKLLAAKTLSEVVELSSAHLRKQFETLTEQGKELSALAQKVATEAAEPIKSGVTKAFNKVGSRKVRDGDQKPIGWSPDRHWPSGLLLFARCGAPSRM
jgi:phasin family protein